MKSWRIIDLTMKISDDMPIYPEDPVPELSASGEPYSDGFRVSSLKLGTHTGTHADAPVHRFADGSDIASVKLSKFAGPAVVIDCTGIGPKVLIETSDLFAHKALISMYRKILFRTDWPERCGIQEDARTKTFQEGENKSPASGHLSFFKDQPGLSREAAVWLASLNVELIGLDLPSVSVSDSAAVHAVLLKHGIVIIENLIGLHKLSRSVVEFHAAPLLLEDADGSPVRAYAIER